MRKICAWQILFVLAVAIPAFSQSRESTHIYIPPVEGNTDQAAYFKQNFEMETTAAGYTLTDTAQNADYTLKLEVQPNIIHYDDGTTGQAPPDEKQNLLKLTLINNTDNSEVVSFSFLFTDLSEMNNYNLYLLYEAMATVPLSETTEEDSNKEDLNHEKWRDKWLYLRVSADVRLAYNEVFKTETLQTVSGASLSSLDNRIGWNPGGTIGLEIQYLEWMSTEVNISLGFTGFKGSSFVPSVQVEQKFPFKPGKDFMIAPYAAASYPLVSSAPEGIEFPSLGVGGGLQFGIKGGERGSIFLDASFIYFPGNVVMDYTALSNLDKVEFRRFLIGLGVGYKIGFLNHKEKQ